MEKVLCCPFNSIFQKTFFFRLIDFMFFYFCFFSVTSQGWQQQSSTASSAVNTTQLGTMAPLNASTWNQQQQQAGNASSAPMLNQLPWPTFSVRSSAVRCSACENAKSPRIVDSGCGATCCWTSACPSTRPFCRILVTFSPGFFSKIKLTKIHNIITDAINWVTILNFPQKICSNFQIILLRNRIFTNICYRLGLEGTTRQQALIGWLISWTWIKRDLPDNKRWLLDWFFDLFCL